MASRKQKIKEKRAQEESEVKQVRMAVAGFAALIIIGIVAYVIIDSGAFDPPFEALSDYTGTPTEICEQATPAQGTGVDAQYESAPDTILEDGVDYQAIFCTSAGAVHVDLNETVAPLTVNSFVFLASNGFYNNTVFHRVLEGFMAQGGDPTGTGRGGPGYQFINENDPQLTFDRAGILAMANAGPNTNGSQFFITFDAAEFLDGGYTIFGTVLSGQENVDALTRIDPQTPNPAITPSDLLTVVIVTPEQVTQQ